MKDLFGRTSERAQTEKAKTTGSMLSFFVASAMAISHAVTKYLAISIGALTVCPFTRLIPLSVIFDYAERSAWRDEPPPKDVSLT
jgi:hypothetical protein